MVPVSGSQAVAEVPLQLRQALPHALPGRIITGSNVGRVAGVIPIGNAEVEVASLGQEPVEQVIVAHRFAQPDMTPICLCQNSQHWIGDVSQLVVVPARLFGSAGVMDVAQNAERAVAGHDEEGFRISNQPSGSVI